MRRKIITVNKGVFLACICAVILCLMYIATLEYRDPRPSRLTSAELPIRRMVKQPGEKHILFWTPFNGMKNADLQRRCIQSCPVQCNVTDDKSLHYDVDVITFHLVDLWTDNWNIGSAETIKFPRDRRNNQIWTLTNHEPPTNLFGDLRVFNGLFNWTAWYRSDAVVPYPYGRPVKLSQEESELVTKDLRTRNFYREKTRNITGRISNCADQGKRYRLVKKLQAHLPIDMYGGCYDNKCFGPDCNQPIEDYRFYLAFENQRCTDYVTEKYWDAILRNQIPIVNWDYSHVNPDLVIPNSFISVFDFPNVEAFVAHVKNVMTNETLYNSYFEWKRHFRPMTPCIACVLCQKLRKEYSPHVVHDLDTWVQTDYCPKVGVS